MRRFYIWRVSIILLTLFIIIFDVIALGYADKSATTVGIGIASFIVAALILGFTTISQLTKDQENWLLFNRTSEKLEREYHLYMLRTNSYSINVSDDKNKADKLFIENVENIILNQGSGFSPYHASSSSSSGFDQISTEIEIEKQKNKNNNKINSNSLSSRSS